ncbi:calcium-binding protein [Candidatus Nitrososphaera sp. FF02]|uniref:calcium-binding protein n=1 Tax=Candidatus Nitrososphaera sp. FF02 TaxID=3398226 RepID=UPI0039E83D7A
MLVVGGVAAPEVTMNRWQPYSAVGPDGAANTEFVFSASASSTEGLDRFEWDFDGDGITDAITATSGTSGTATTSYWYDSLGMWVPKARAVDTNGLPSVWVAYEQAGEPVALDTFVPEIDATLSFEQVGETLVDESGAVSATFLFAVESDADIASLQWDFNGDGMMDLTTTSASTSHTYTLRGMFLPNVTVEDGFGTRVLVSSTDSAGQLLYASVLAPGEDPALYDPVKTYCNNMTVDQLIAGGSYNVMDFRSEDGVIIRGTSGDDLILGGSTKNLIFGGAGNDCIITGGGGGQVYGNAGDDIIFGNAGDERLVGGSGSDTCSTGGGSDVVVGCEFR